EVAIIVCPLVPNRHTVVTEVADVTLTTQKPQQFNSDRFEVHALRGDEGKLPGKIETDLPAEQAAGTRARAIRFGGAVLEHLAQQVFVRGKNLGISHGRKFT